MMAATLRTPLILCCAEENEVALVRVLDELHREGLRPEVLAGVDSDGGLLTAAVDRTTGPALFVLCESDELDRSATRRLSGLFSARKGPAHRIITVGLAAARPLASLPAIRDALHEMDGAPPPAKVSATPIEDDRVLLRDVVGTTAVTAVPNREEPLSDEEKLARDLHREMVAAEALLTQGRSGAAPVPKAIGGPEPGAPTALLDEDDAGPRSLAAQSAASLTADPFASVPDAESLAHTPAASPAVDVAPEPAAALSGASQAAAAAPARRGRGILVAVAIAAIAALALVAVYNMSASKTPRGAGAGRGAPVPASVANDDSSSAPPQATKATGGAEAAVKLADPKTADAPKPAEDDTAGEAKVRMDAGAEDPPNPEPEAADGGAATPTTPPPPDDREALVVDQALVDGKIRALDNLLIWPSTSRSMTWSEARKYCRGRRLGTLRGWRMATVAELNRLNRSRMLTSGILWSRQRNEADDESKALDAKSGTFNWYLDMEAAARPACVRKR